MLKTKVCTITEKNTMNSELLEKPVKYKWNFVWINIILLSILHASALYGFYLLKFTSEVKISSRIFVYIWAYFSATGITSGNHRLFTHRSYKANLPYQILVVFMASMNYSNSVYIWVRDHRVHHKYSETDADPHNAKRGFFFSHVGWLMLRKHPDVMRKGQTVDMSDMLANPVVMFQHKYYYYIVFTVTFLMPMLIPWYFWNESLKVTYFYTCIYNYIVTINLIWCINSIAHLYGPKPYDKDIGPTENPLMTVLGIGEGFHNYHHTFPMDYKAAEFGSDIRNPTTYFIDFFAKIGWVTDRIIINKETIDRQIQKSGDGSDDKKIDQHSTWSTKYLAKHFYNSNKSIIIFLCALCIVG